MSGVRDPRGLAWWSGFRRLDPAPGIRQLLPGWLAVGATAVVLGMVTARAASSRSTSAALILLAVLVPFLLMLVRDARRALLLVVVFDTAFQWDRNFGYDKSAASLGALGGLNVSATTIALLGLYLMWFAELATRRTAIARGTLRAAVPLIVYVGFTALSLVAAENKALAAGDVVLLIQTLLLFVYLVGTVKTRADAQFLTVALVLSLGAESLITLALPLIGNQNIIGIRTYTTAGSASEGLDSRFAGTFGSPNVAASFFSLLAAPALVLFATDASRWTKRFAMIALGTATVALTLTLSRGGWIAYVVSLLFLFLVGTRRGWISPRIPVLTAIALTLLLLPFGGHIASRITGSDQGSARSRVPLIHLASAVIRDHPLLGVGADNVAIVFPKYAGPQYDQDWIHTVHNKYLLVWAEAGFGALAGFVWFLVATLRRGWRVWQSADLVISALALGLTAGLIGRIVHMGVDTFQSRAQIQSLVIVAGLLAAMYSIITREGGNDTEFANNDPIAASNRNRRGNRAAVTGRRR
jgi:O-antigen ligase